MFYTSAASGRDFQMARCENLEVLKRYASVLLPDRCGVVNNEALGR